MKEARKPDAMKSLLPISVVIVLFLSLTTANGQCPSPAGAQVVLPPPVTGAPFSADLVNEVTHMGRDGNRVQSETHGKVYRDAQGRGRCDMENVKTKIITWANISDPVAGLFIHLDLAQKTAIVTHHSQTAQAPSPKPPAEVKPPVKVDSSNVSEEELGSQAIEGFRVTGKRYINTTETGQRTEWDDWYSPDLKATLLSTHTDERSNSLANKVVNIKAEDPDPAVFQVPEGYTVKDWYCRGSRCNYDSP